MLFIFAIALSKMLILIAFEISNNKIINSNIKLINDINKQNP